MTTEPELIKPTDTPQQLEQRKKERAPEVHPLESLFTLGYAISDRVEVFNNGKVELKAIFRTLTPAEIRDVAEEVTKYFSAEGQSITLKIETLARAIQDINYMPLILSKDDQEKYHKDLGYVPSPLESAKIILRDKIRSLLVIDALYKAYDDFTAGVMKQFEDAKKK